MTTRKREGYIEKIIVSFFLYAKKMECLNKKVMKHFLLFFCDLKLKALSTLWIKELEEALRIVNEMSAFRWGTDGNDG